MGFANDNLAQFLDRTKSIFDKTQLKLMDCYVSNSLSLEADETRIRALFEMLSEGQREDILQPLID